MKKNKTLWMVLGVVLFAAIAVGVFFAVKALTKPSGDPESTTLGSETASVTDTGEVPETTLDPISAAAKNKEVYTDEAIPGDDSRWDLTAATCGDYTLDNRGAQIQYFMQYIQYASYGSMLGMDISKPLSEQASMTEGLNWEQFLLAAGMEDFHQYAAAATKATAAGYTLPEEENEQLESILAGLPDDATNYGFDSVEAYLQESFGPGVRLEDYEKFLRLYFLAMSYENNLYENLTWNDEDLKAYMEAHPEEFSGMDAETPNVDVRHILIIPATSSSEGDDGTEAQTEDQTAAREAALAKAQDILKEYLQDESEEHFAELAGKYSEDPGSKDNGGLYEDVYPGQMVPSFNDWCFDASRKPGDVAIVETDYGYHVMYFVKQTENYHWKTVAEENYPMSIMDTKIQEFMEEIPVTVNFENVVLAPLPKEETEPEVELDPTGETETETQAD